jgi:gamma-glutamyltranspeptidase/glutathione hydrolase
MMSNSMKLRSLNAVFCLLLAIGGFLTVACGLSSGQDGPAVLPDIVPAIPITQEATPIVRHVLLPDNAAIGRHGMVATVNPYATDAGIKAMKLGGNAIDAAVAAAVMLGVVDTHNSGLGGGCFILIRRSDGNLLAIDGRETAPAAATRDMFLADGKAVPELSRNGPLAVGVPGALAAYEMAVRDFGKLKLGNILSWAADRAEIGFPLSAYYARNVAAVCDRGIDQYPGLGALFLRDGKPIGEGDCLRQPDLSRTYRKISQYGCDWFYGGEFAQRVSGWMAENGGLITTADFANYRAKRRDPVRSSYRQYTIVGFPPPSSGGVHVAQMLNMLEPFDLHELHQEDPATATHVIAESMKLAFADRAHWLGDADFARVPRGLVSPEYGRRLSDRIRTDQTIEVTEHAVPENWEQNLFGKHTTHIAAADDAGNWVAITATINTSYGSKVLVPGTGVVLNNQMDDFSAQPGVPNFFGLIGSENNAVEPGKRPLSSMSPTIVLEDGQPILTVGAAGGPRIITQVLLTIIRHLDYDMRLDEAIGAPRFHHQWTPAHLRCESSFPKDQQDRLAELGHVMMPGGSGGVAQAIAKLPDGRLIGVHDPRVPGKAAGW